MNEVQLSKRLTMIASFIRKGAYFADIGTDHAYLPTYVCLKDKEAKAIASDVSDGPFQVAKKTVQLYGLTDRVDVRLDDGLKGIKKEEPLTDIVVAGMGGKLILDIVTDIDEYLSVKRLILQPNNEAIRLRQFFYEHSFRLTDEKVVEENGHFYDILIFDKNEDKNVYDTEVCLEKQLLFGPLLMREKSQPFLAKWQREREKWEAIVLQMERSKQNLQSEIDLFKQKIKWVEEVTK